MRQEYPQPFKVETYPWGVEEYRRIKAYQCRNFDGTLAGYKPETPEGERELVEKKFIPFDEIREVRYTNYW